MRNYDNPITVLLTGSGNSSAANTSVLFEDFIFGNLSNADAKFLVVKDSKAVGISTAVKVLAEWGIDQTSGDLAVVNTYQGALGGLEFAQTEGRDVYVVSLFDPNSEADLTEITQAKNKGITTLNLCSSLVDHFEGYESEEDRIHREAVTAAFEEQQKAKEEAEGTAKPARKRAPAKKAATPRKKATTKPLEEESKPLEDEPENVPQMAVGDTVEVGGLYFTKTADSPFPEHNKSGLDKLVANAVAREEEKKAAKTELSGTIVMGSSDLPKELVPAKPIVPTPDVWQDVASSVPATGDTITVRKADIVELGDAMQMMATGFTEALNVYKRMVTGE